MSSEKIVDVKTLSHLFQVPIKTIYHWVHIKRIPYLKMGRHLRFEVSKVKAVFEVDRCVRRSDCQEPSADLNLKIGRSLKNRLTIRQKSFASDKRS